MEPAARAPTIEDLEALPPSVKGEIIEGTLYTMTRPRGRHQRIVRLVASRIGDAYEDGNNGPGGWWILPEPGIELPSTPEVAPDVAGWRRERLVELPEDEAIAVVPDWVCEILSPSTRRHDLLIKKPYYARVGVAYHWLVDRAAQTLTSYRLEQGRWLELAVYGDETDAQIEPFHDVGVDVAGFWR